MRAARCAWVLNLDAEMEMAGETPSASLRARLALQRARARALLLGPEDRLLGEDPIESGSLQGVMWCPTPGALSAFRAAGIAPAAHPPVEVVRAVNHRRFCASLGLALPGAVFAEGTAALRALEERVRTGGSWLAKRAFGAAGRGQRRFRGGLGEGDRRWLRASHRGVQIEPLLAVESELALHGWVTPSGRTLLGAPTLQRRRARACFESRLTRLDPGRELPLRHAAERVAAALHGEGYFGPFGIDALVHGPAGRLHPLSEINARYTMGWAIGMGDGTVRLMEMR